MGNELKPVKAGHVTWEVTVSEEGMFRASAPGMSDCYGTTYEAMAESCKVKSSQARVRVAVPYTTFTRRPGSRPTADGGWQAVHGVATGIHGSNGNLLIKPETGRPEQLGWSVSDYYRQIPEADEHRVLELRDQMNALKKEETGILDKYRFKNSMKEAVQREVSEAAAAARANDDAAAE